MKKSIFFAVLFVFGAIGLEAQTFYRNAPAPGYHRGHTAAPHHVQHRQSKARAAITRKAYMNSLERMAMADGRITKAEKRLLNRERRTLRKGAARRGARGCR